MPTTYTDQFYVIDPGNPPASGTVLNFQVYTVIDQDNNGRIQASGNDFVGGLDVTSTWRNDTITVEWPDGSVHTITGVTFYRASGPAVFTPNDGSILQNGVKFLSSTWVNTSTFMPVSTLGPACFVKGTLIETDTGPRLIEELREGDLVLTRDAGPMPILWISHRFADGTGEHAPIRVMKGALGNDRDLFVSPQHRLMIDGWRAELFFGQDEILVAAKHLVGSHDKIHVHTQREVEYFHLLLDGHHLIWAEGSLSESFDPGGDFAMQDPVVRKEVEERFPGFLETKGAKLVTARSVIRGREACVLYA